MIRRFGLSPKQGQKYTRRPGAYVLLPDGGDLLLTHQSEPWPEFQLPGGGIDPGESPIRALYREVLEETGWTIAAPRRVGAFRRFTYMPEYEIWAEKICTIYVAQPVRQIADPTEDGHTAHWMPLSDATDLLGNSGDRHFAGQLLQRLI
ncbi:NUDIX hydrolase [Thalassovita sp.]|jgi:8-oxo-dGTP diphosphatase|uniref:NUDIX hydrolase n=1 Tax=Thalassovita sp. TaxID=1979401 RepID=UPI003B5A3EDE